jgi:hypothetical protein
MEAGAGAPLLVGSVLPPDQTSPEFLTSVLDSAVQAGVTVIRGWAHGTSPQYPSMRECRCSRLSRHRSSGGSSSLLPGDSGGGSSGACKLSLLPGDGGVARPARAWSPLLSCVHDYACACVRCQWSDKSANHGACGMQ